MTMTYLVTDTGSEEGGREAALELPSDWGVDAKAGRIYLLKNTIFHVSTSQIHIVWQVGAKKKGQMALAPLCTQPVYPPGDLQVRKMCSQEM